MDEEISIGDYILTGGEIPAMVIADALIRLIPGVLNVSSLEKNHFLKACWSIPNYAAREYEGMHVPEILLSGDHEKSGNGVLKRLLNAL